MGVETAAVAARPGERRQARGEIAGGADVVVAIVADGAVEAGVRGGNRIRADVAEGGEGERAVGGIRQRDVAGAGDEGGGAGGERGGGGGGDVEGGGGRRGGGRRSVFGNVRDGE